ncbi:cupin-like domain-containing protein [soil metagenome]
MIRRPIDEQPEATPADLVSARIGSRPVVLRGLVRNWPIVQTGMQGDAALRDYLVARDAGAEAVTFVGSPEIGGRFFYDDTLRGFNFERRPSTVTGLLGRLDEVASEPNPPALYMGAAAIAQTMPQFARDNPAPALPDDAQGRLWMGNATTVQTHYDLSANLACVAAGRRTFTLYPPEQAANLYVGPLEFTLAGQPVSLVDPLAPDDDRFPLYRIAEAEALQATLLPGDALYIPPLWWHHVQALDTLNLLVNYWWSTAPSHAGSPFESLIHGLLSIRSLPDEERAAWKALFDHFVFSAGPETVAHIPEGARGVLGDLTPETARTIRQFLIGSLSRRRDP